jgi:hypothetical protein
VIVDSFFSFLGAQSGVTSLCPRIYPLTIPEGANPPAITFSLDSDERDQLFDGPGDLKQALIDTSSWSLDHANAHAIADAVEAALANYRGTFGSKTAEHIRLARKFELFESDSGLYRVSQQFLIAYH